MENFADYILAEQDLAAKMEIVYYLAKKEKIFFDQSVVFKTEIARMFLNYSKIDVDKNLLLTACLLCNCKKIDNAQEIGSIHTYAIDGAKYLGTMGFDQKFCKICEEVNRYSNSNPREKESDVLELVDQFGGMLLDRPERIGFKPDEALVLLEHRNLKDVYNRYLETFIEFVNYMENIKISEVVNMTAFRRLIKLHNDTQDMTKFIKEVVYEYEPKVDKLMLSTTEESKEKPEENVVVCNANNPNRPLFSAETTRKIMNHINDDEIV